MNRTLNILVVEDSENDAFLLLRALRRGNFEAHAAVVDTAPAMRSALEQEDWDVITSDHAMPHFSAPEALALAKELRPDVPFVIVSGEIDLNLAVSLIKEGADDYVQKQDLARLVPTIEHHLREVEIRRDNQLAQDALKISETRYRRLFETAQDGILILDANTGKVIDVNPFMEAMLGYKKEAFLGKKLWELGAFRDIETSRLAYLELQEKGYIRYDNLPLVAHDGRQVAVEFVSNIYYVDWTKIAQCNIRDITVREQSVRDHLTGLFNQRYMEETLERELSRASRNHAFLSIMMLEVDDLKQINDTYGQAAGDTILHELGSLLLDCIRKTDVPSRFRGDKFIIVLSDATRQVLPVLAERLRENVRCLHFQFGNKTQDPINLSFGAAAFPVNGVTCSAIVNAADNALFRAMHEGGDRMVMADLESNLEDV